VHVGDHQVAYRGGDWNADLPEVGYRRCRDHHRKTDERFEHRDAAKAKRLVAVPGVGVDRDRGGARIHVLHHSTEQVAANAGDRPGIIGVGKHGDSEAVQVNRSDTVLDRQAYEIGYNGLLSRFVGRGDGAEMA
jgi:hypothetical protein